ncbi:hypothetical protein PRJ_4666 [Pseudomonas sp. XWY-1]|nr:hypothetical protein PRJ_4666 [Pseudomonas sp. XWY-1]
MLVLGNAQAHRSHIPCGSGRAREAGDAVPGTGFAGVRGQARPHRICACPWKCAGPSVTYPLWERACPRSRRRGAWHRLRRCSRASPPPQDLCLSLEMRRPIGHISPVGAGVPAKQATRCLAPASPVFAGKPAPTGSVLVLGNVQAVGHISPVGAGVPAKQATRCLAPASPVFAGSPHRICACPWKCAGPSVTYPLWERACPRSRRRGAWHRLRRCSRARSYRGCVAFGNAQAHQSWAKRISRVCPINNGAFASVTPRM